MSDRRPTGLFPADMVKRTAIARLPRTFFDQLAGLSDWTGNLSDAMDELGLPSGVPAVPLRPFLEGARIVGPVLTVRNAPVDPTHPRATRLPGQRMGDVECYHLAERGDVLVVEGVEGVSSMGGISAAIGQWAGVLGAIVAGSVRDVAHARSVGFPVWATGSTPASGKYRLATVEIMGPVTIGGVAVEPGDIVAADETGVCFLPYAEAVRILERARGISERETVRLSRLEDELPPKR